MALPPSPTTRLEAFSDGVIAVIITIMVLELKVPHESGIMGLRTVLPTLGVYALSFTFTAIYWINHHHLLRRTEEADQPSSTPTSSFCSASRCCRSSLPT